MASESSASASASAAGGEKYRNHIYGEGEKDTKWRFGAPPDYSVVNKLFEEGRSKEWPKGSLEEQVQTLVKTWEMEIFHKTDPKDFKTMNPETYRLSVNGATPLTLKEVTKIGGYNAMLHTSLPENLRAYNPEKETSESSHKAFTTTFPRGFAWEVFEVYSGPPVIAYKFRHWAFMEGPFNGHPPTGEKVVFFGMAIFGLDEEMKVERVEFFYDPGELIGQLIGRPKITDGSETATLGCPFFHK